MRVIQKNLKLHLLLSVLKESETIEFKKSTADLKGTVISIAAISMA
jgi:hypothetical protein